MRVRILMVDPDSDHYHHRGDFEGKEFEIAEHSSATRESRSAGFPGWVFLKDRICECRNDNSISCWWEPAFLPAPTPWE